MVMKKRVLVQQLGGSVVIGKYVLSMVVKRVTGLRYIIDKYLHNPPIQALRHFYNHPKVSAMKNDRRYAGFADIFYCLEVKG